MVREQKTYLPVEAQDMTEEQAQEKQSVRRKTVSKEWEHFVPEFVNTKAQSFDVKAAVKQVETGQKLFTDARLSQAEARIKIPTDLPVSVSLIGDVHFGSIYTEHQEFLDDVETVRRTPNAYAVFMSNMIDNAIPSQFPSNMLANPIPPDKQVLAMRKIAEELNKDGKLLGAITSPCHEGWTYKHTGQDVNALIYGFPDRKFPVLENGGQLHLEVGEQEYTMALYHQVGPFESNFNETHALRQLNRLNLQMKADVVAGAHRHFAAAEMVYEGTGEERKPTAYVRTGTYKGTGEIHDQFSVDRYGATGEPSAQTVELWPKVRRIEVYLEHETGILAHEAHYVMESVKNDKEEAKRKRAEARQAKKQEVIQR